MDGQRKLRSRRQRTAAKAAMVLAVALVVALFVQMERSSEEPGTAEERAQTDDDRIILEPSQTGRLQMDTTRPQHWELSGIRTECDAVPGAESFAFVQDPSAYTCQIDDDPASGHRRTLQLVPETARVAVDATSVEINALRRQGLRSMVIHCVEWHRPDDTGRRQVEGTVTRGGITTVTRNVGNTYVNLWKPDIDLLEVGWAVYADGNEVAWSCWTSTLEPAEVSRPELALEALSHIIV